MRLICILIGRKAIIPQEYNQEVNKKTNLVLGDAAGEPLQPQVSGTNAPAAKTHGHTIGPEVSKINTQSVKCIGIKTHARKSRSAHAGAYLCTYKFTARVHTAENQRLISLDTIGPANLFANAFGLHSRLAAGG